MNNINPNNVIQLIIRAMEIVEIQYSNKSGDEKKSQVLNIVYDVVNKSNMSIEQKDYLIELINNVFDSVVEGIVLASKGKIDINKAVGCFTKFIELLKKMCNYNKVL